MHRHLFPVEKMCSVFEVSKSGYYHWLNAEPSKRWKENEALLIDIQDVFESSHKTYGSPRITKELRENGKKASRPRVARIMRSAGMYAIKPKKFKVTTDSKHNYPIAPNLLKREFNTSRSNEVWVSDITYIRTRQGWLYLTIVMDLFDRKIVGWSTSNNLSAQDTSIRAFRMALQNQPITDSLIFHSDRGIQYACTAFTNLLNRQNGCVKQSMSRKGDCWDNAVAESFFKTLKTELIYRNKYISRSHADMDVFWWIETWYNRKRRHSALGMLSLEEFENLMVNPKMVA